MNFYNATPTVLALRKLTIQGNILPPSWLHHLRYQNGKPHPVAAIILSDIVYWYRPVELRDEATGLVTGYAQKFKEDKLQRDYKSYVKQYGFSMSQVKRAFQCLVGIGIVDLEFRTVRVSPKRLMGNVMYIGLNPTTLQIIGDPMNIEVHRGTRTKVHSPTRVEVDTPTRIEVDSPTLIEVHTLQRLLNTEITCSTENTNPEILDDDDGFSSLFPSFVQEKNEEDPRVEIRAMRQLAAELIDSMGKNAWTGAATYIAGLTDGELADLVSWLWLWGIHDRARYDPYQSDRYKSNPFDGLESVPGKIITQVRRGASADLLDDDWQDLAETILTMQEQQDEQED